MALGLIKSQPGKAIYTLFALAFNALRLPLWMIYYIPPFLRQHSKWSHKQAVRVRIVRAFLAFSSAIEMRTPLSLEPGSEKDQWVVISPATASHYTGYAAKDQKIKPATIGGTWYPAVPAGGDKQGWTVLHFHGGAYTIGDGRKQDAGFCAKTLLANTDATHVFAPQYRLASNGDRFPSQLQDAITSYNYLTHVKNIPANRIIFSGDSAGANLLLALLRYITDFGAETGIQAPGNAWAWSPWVSPGAGLDGHTIAKFPPGGNDVKDYVTTAFGNWGGNTLRPSKTSGMDLWHPAISAADNPFKTETPILISTGECEMLFYDDCALAEQMKAVPGNNVELRVEDNAPHDIILVGGMTGFEAEATKAAKAAGEFLRATAKL